MNENRDTAREIAALEACLETYGGDAGRWPRSAHTRFAALIAREPQAQRLLAEARALDRVLDGAPQVDKGRQAAAAARILETAGVDEADARGRAHGRVVAFPASARRPGVPRRTRTDNWQAAALLAASLLLGVFVGVNGTFDTAISGLTNLAGLSGETDGIVLALDPSGLPIFDEDQL